MKRFFTRLIFCSIVTFTALTACEKVSSLNDSANIEQVSIIGNEPATAIFREPEIKGNIIELPLAYGKYLFPLTVSFDVKTQKGCVQLLGFDEGSSFTFDHINHIRNLYTVATSGATTLWKIQIVDAMSNESAEIVQAGATTAGEGDVLVAPIAQIDRFNASVTFQGTGAAAYPLTLTPQITLSDDAKFTAEFPKQLTFESEEDIKEYTVEAASGRTKVWKFQSIFVGAKDNSSSSNLSEDQVRRLTVIAEDVRLSSQQAQLKESKASFNVSSTGGVLNLMVTSASGSVEFPLKATIEIPVDPQSVLFGATKDNSYEFTSYSDRKQVWVADKISGLIKCWTIALFPETNTGIKSYTITSFTSKVPTMIVDKENIVIDNQNSRIIVPIENGLGTAIDEKEDITLRLNISLGLYEGSKCTTTNTRHTYITNTGSLSVSSANGLERRSWTVYLKDKNAEKSSDASLMNLSILEYTSQGNRMALSKSSYTANNDTKTITLSIEEGIDAFPLVITKKSLRTRHNATRIFPASIADYDAPMVFESLNSVKEFSSQAEDGTTEEWKIDLTTTAIGKTAEITGLQVTRASNGAIPADVEIDAENSFVTIMVDGIPPFDLTVAITTSDNAKVTGLNNGFLTFDSYDRQIPATVTSQDGSVTKTWNIGIERPTKIQIANSNFESWGKFKNVNGGTFTIDPMPGAGYGWGTANLEIAGIGVQGTLPVERTDGTKGAEMTTMDQNTVFKGYIVAAGTLYTGIFNLNIDYITQPRKMTKFGIPFTARPASFDMEVKYAPGPQLKEATADSKGKYSIREIEGTDKGHIWAELVRWTGKGAIDYDGSIGAENISVLGRAELVIDGTDNPYKEWTKINLPMVYTDAAQGLTPTHIVVVMSSSKDGDKFIGATGSKLSVDNFVINY